MKTIKLPVTITEDISNIIRQQNTVVRFAYNRFVEGLDQKKIRTLVKSMKGLDSLDSWFIQCAILEAKGLFSSRQALDKQLIEDGESPLPPVIFGSRKAFNKLKEGKISHEEFKKLRNRSLVIQGEAQQKGNRKLRLDLDNNQLIFKPIKGTKIKLSFPELRPNIKKELISLQKAAESKQIPFFIRLSQNTIWISFDEKILTDFAYQSIHGRVMGIDLNPDAIGISITEGKKVIYNSHIDITELHELSTNKKNHELISLCKKITNIASQYQCSKLCMEELNIASKDNKKGKKLNKKLNNDWNRNLVINNIKKRCVIKGVEFIQVNPAYSSVIGNMMFNYTDPVNASLEIGRRGDKKFEKGQFYPNMDFGTRWKESTISNCKSWVEVGKLVKNSKMRYRASTEEVVFRNKYRKFNIEYSFI